MSSSGQPPGPPARDRLLVAAEELFYTRGIASTGVDAVVARAGVATASMYKHFRGKDDLVAAYLTARDDRWREHWEAHVAAHDDAHERILALFAAIRDWDAGPGSSHGCAHVSASLQLPAEHPGRAVARRHKQHIVERLGRLVVDAGIPAPDEVTQDLLLIYEGMFTLLALDLDPDPVERARRLARQRLTAAVGPRR